MYIVLLFLLAVYILGMPSIEVAHLYIVFVLSLTKDFLSSKLPNTSILRIILNIAVGVTLFIALIGLFGFFDHPRRYKNDLETLGMECESGPCK